MILSTYSLHRKHIREPRLSTYFLRANADDHHFSAEKPHRLNQIAQARGDLMRPVQDSRRTKDVKSPIRLVDDSP